MSHDWVAIAGVGVSLCLSIPALILGVVTYRHTSKQLRQLEREQAL